MIHSDGIENYKRSWTILIALVIFNGYVIFFKRLANVSILAAVSEAEISKTILFTVFLRIFFYFYLLFQSFLDLAGFDTRSNTRSWIVVVNVTAELHFLFLLLWWRIFPFLYRRSRSFLFIPYWSTFTWFIHANVHYISSHFPLFFVVNYLNWWFAPYFLVAIAIALEIGTFISDIFIIYVSFFCLFLSL